MIHNIKGVSGSLNGAMKSVLFWVFLIMLINIFSLPGQSINQWQNYEDSVGTYSVLLPDTELRTQVDTMLTELGVVYYHTVFFHREEDKGVSLYKVSWCDYPEKTVHSDSLDLVNDFFEATIESAVEVVQGKLIYKEPIYMDGYPARQWRIHYNKGNAVLHSAACLVDNRYFLLQSAAPREYGLSPEIERFLSSWRYSGEE